MKNSDSFSAANLTAIGPWPLMRNNVTREDLDCLIEYLEQDDLILTQSTNVRAFEREWSEWLGVKHSVFVHSGSAANLVTMASSMFRCSSASSSAH